MFILMEIIYILAQWSRPVSEKKIPSAYHSCPLIIINSIGSGNFHMFPNLWINASCLSPFGTFSSKWRVNAESLGISSFALIFCLFERNFMWLIRMCTYLCFVVLQLFENINLASPYKSFSFVHIQSKLSKRKII